MAEGEGFEPPDELPHLLISSQVPLTTQPPFRDSLFLGIPATSDLTRLPWYTALVYSAL